MTLGLEMKRVESSAQKAANWAVVATLGSSEDPIMEPEVGCMEGSL